jgi:predicted ATP-grasp superfamily ATP-dependent carboligase
MEIRPLAGVLVTDAMQRKSLAAIRALGEAGVRVVAGEWTALAAGRFSRFASPAHLPRASRDEEELVRVAVRVCRHRRLDVILPMEEATLLALLRHRGAIPRRLRIPFPPLPVVEAARDKARVLEKAGALGIPAPRTVRFDGHGVLAEEPPLPAVIKPRISSGAVGLRFAATREELRDAVQELRTRFPDPLVQERIPPEGEGIGVSVLMGKTGEVHALFTHRRLREYPVSGGASTLRESARDPEAEEAAVALLRALGWRGVAMVEFKRDLRDGRPKLMEVNPRFWGSLALAVRAGVNFPLLLVRWARGETMGPRPEYALGVRARWLLPGDLLHFFANPNRFRLEPSFFRFREKNLHYDILDPRDPWPVLGTALSLLPFMLDPELRRFLRR